MASAYLFHLAANRPFPDGNKRAAVLSALVFLESNGLETLPAQEELEAITLLIASSQMSKEALTDWMRQRSN
ncbi:MAG: type II toxin-antitoxin system death-on-curing family toxin [Cytophagales bacterium]|nr:type II toxin-antitoxin system death-on-curing family toxin [Armatimonadota bacterium]